MGKVITISNHKGGVGKTTTVVNLAAAFAEAGGRILCIDCDSQGDLSDFFIRGLSFEHSVADLFQNNDVDPTQLIHQTEQENIDLIPADRRLERVEHTTNYYDHPFVRRFQQTIAAFSETYTVVVIDTATRPHLTTFAALASSQSLVVPLDEDPRSFRAAASIRQQARQAQQTVNPNLQIRHLFAKAKNDLDHATFRDALVSTVGDESVLDHEIPDAKPVRISMALRKPMVTYSKRSKTTNAIRHLANEVLYETVHYEESKAA